MTIILLLEYGICKISCEIGILTFIGSRILCRGGTIGRTAVSKNGSLSLHWLLRLEGS